MKEKRRKFLQKKKTSLIEKVNSLVDRLDGKKDDQFDFERFRLNLEKKRDHARKVFVKKHRKSLRWLERRGLDFATLTQKGIRVGAAAMVLASLIAGYGIQGLEKRLTGVRGEKSERVERELSENDLALAHSLVARLQKYLPTEVSNLEPNDTEDIAAELSNSFGFPIKTTLEDHILPSYYGFTGYEQHLLRYPGDATFYHVQNAEEWEKYGTEGMAPSTGAWGYFAFSKEALSDDLVEAEKWYAVCQTFLIPGWDGHWAEYAEWYRYRKVIMVNVETGQACVCPLGDSGPATWTGKTFGASPEAMWALGLGTGPRRGKVLMFFVDDPKSLVPLGPISPREVETLAEA